MRLQNVKEKLDRFGQAHLLKYYEELSMEEQAALLEQIERLDFSVIEAGKVCQAEETKGEIRPIPAMTIAEINEKRDVFEPIGCRAIQAGKVGAILLAGGMGTRLGSDNPKGMYDIGVTRELYIFECLINNLMDVVKKAGGWIHLFVMTSEKNDEATRGFFAEKNYFGYPKEYVHFFIQDMAPATDYDGKVFLETKGRVSTSPNGNGGWYSSFTNCGLSDYADREGIEWLNVFAVDNVLQRIADPTFIGAAIAGNYVSGSKVIRKADRNEKVGVICLEDGKPSIIEYYEMNDDMLDAKDEKGEPLYNYGVILNYLFRKDKLDEIVSHSMMLHIVEKKIPYLDEQGVEQHPEVPNGHKYETLILDMIKMLDNTVVYEVEREREFAPIKNKTGVDSVESARALLQKNGVVL